MLLVLTGSLDGTADLIFGELKTKAFRLNHDTFSEYEVSVQPNFWSIRNPAGFEITSKTATAVWWWKASNYFAHDEKFIAEEVKYVFRELYNWFALNGKPVKGNTPDFHRAMGKMNILSVAEKYFPIPNTWTGWGFTKLPEWTETERVVCKSLSSGLTTTDKALFTTEVTGKKLAAEFPWYLQGLVESDADVTVFVCGHHLFSFERDRSQLKGLDWRAEQNLENPLDDWVLLELPNAVQNAIHCFCHELKIDWGRLDLMRSNDKYVFLEFNANGQWVFLDYENKYGLLESVCKYLVE
jgi:hypothetical protein